MRNNILGIIMGKDKNGFIVTFGGDIESVDSEILISNLLATTRILEEINNQLSSGKEKITISIKPFATGSFAILYHIAYVPFITGFVNYMIGGGASYAKMVFDIFVDINKIKNFLEGKKPASVTHGDQHVEIKDNHGTINIYNLQAFDLYKNNPEINESLNKTFRGLQKTENISNYQLKDDENKEVFLADRKDFPKLSSPNEYIEENKHVKYDENAKLIIFKMVFAPGYKWTFIYQERKISAMITDEEFYKKTIHDSYKEGDYFEARLKITQVYDMKYKTFIDEDYEVTNIIRHVPTPKQQDLKY